MDLQEEIVTPFFRSVFTVYHEAVIVLLAHYELESFWYSAIVDRRTSYWPVRSNTLKLRGCAAVQGAPDMLRGKKSQRHCCLELPLHSHRHPN
jgi:hypothetical protein